MSSMKTPDPGVRANAAFLITVVLVVGGMITALLVKYGVLLHFIGLIVALVALYAAVYGVLFWMEKVARK